MKELKNVNTYVSESGIRTLVAVNWDFGLFNHKVLFSFKITYNKVQWMSRSIMCQLWDEKREFLQSSGICQLIDATN